MELLFFQIKKTQTISRMISNLLKAVVEDLPFGQRRR
jgi:hypothetical protein